MSPSNSRQRTESEWLRQLDARSQAGLVGLLELRLVQDAKAGKLSKARFQRFLLEVGLGIIQMFPVWLATLVGRKRKRDLTLHFWDANLKEEHDHWVWWMEMAEAFGVFASAFARHRLGTQMAMFSELLTYWSRRAPLGVCLAVINLVVETGAALITREIAPYMLPRMSERAGRWLAAHAKGDQVHARITRRCLDEAVRRDPKLGDELLELVPAVYSLYRQALASAY